MRPGPDPSAPWRLPAAPASRPIPLIECGVLGGACTTAPWRAGPPASAEVESTASGTNPSPWQRAQLNRRAQDVTRPPELPQELLAGRCAVAVADRTTREPGQPGVRPDSVPAWSVTVTVAQ
ncbi:DUF6207 family protein [Streptomyces sp. NPDC127190]|uniref:DUF6207 family protein n=1 Tax=unclassified Streptomyces TaxID=2593676 RepID=UPI003635BE67